MAKTSYVSISAGAEESFYKYLNATSRFVFPRLTRKISLLSVKRKKGVTQKSLLLQVASLWNALSDSDRAAWSAAGAECDLNGWRLFVQDTCARIINDLPGAAIPSTLHQSWVGALSINSPATEIKIKQLHPHYYWVSQSVRGKKGMREPVLIDEDFVLPVELSISYKSDLTEVGSGAFARYYLRLWQSYQGVDIYSDYFIDLDLSTDWKRENYSVTALLGRKEFGAIVIGDTFFGAQGDIASDVAFGTYKFGAGYYGEENTFLGLAIGYDLFIHLYNLQGDFYFDNIEVTHSGQNWARDPFCKDINQGFTLAFYQVPKHWVAEILPDGAEYNSIYIDG